MSDSGVVSGYRLLMPGGWQRITTGEGSAASITAFIAQQTRTLSGTDRVLAERAMQERLQKVVAEAADTGALDLYFFSRHISRVQFTMSFVVSMIFLGQRAADLDEAELAEAAGFGASETQWVDFGAGRFFRSVARREQTIGQLRDETVALLGQESIEGDDNESEAADEMRKQIAAEEANGRVIRSTRVDYLAAVPDAAGAFLLLTFSSTDSALTEAEIYTFDAIVSTLNWNNA